MTAAATQRAIDAVWRIESARVIAALARMTGDIGLAEDLAQDALVAALEQWPTDGVPANPGAWLTSIAKRRGIDRFRRNATFARKLEELGHATDFAVTSDFDAVVDDRIEDDLLRLMFTTCHPVLSSEARVALTLRLLGGLTTDEIARAFLVPEATVAQRIVRAKKTLAKERVTLEAPIGHERARRLTSVLGCIYLIFNEGYSATAGEDWLRPALCEDALRLARILAGLAPNDAEVHGLVALLDIQSSRSRARVGVDGQPILLLEQDRGRWDYLLIGRGLAALERAQALSDQRGTYTIQAAIAACHARARTADATHWQEIARLYDDLARLSPTPVVALNRAVAVAMAFGPAEGLALVDALLDEPGLARYHLLPSVRADLLSKLGRLDEARVEFERAASLTRNERERTFLLDRAAAAGRPATP